MKPASHSNQQTHSQRRAKPPFLERLLRWGCLPVFVSLCVLGYLAATVHWKYSLAATGLFVVWLILAQINGARFQRELLGVLNAAFLAKGHPVPELKRGGHYGWPTFTLVFTTEAELKQAMRDGCISAFKQSVQDICISEGSRRNPFDVSKAVAITHKGPQS
ncbi:MAG: hypothetical protein ACO1TE_00660 [Prosthecobacter sp.]